MVDLYVLFGVATKDIDEARSWVETALARKLAEDEKGHLGRYFFLDGSDREALKLCSGVSQDDEEGEYPTDQDFRDEALLIFLDDTRDDSPWLRALEARPDRFVKLRANRYED